MDTDTQQDHLSDDSGVYRAMRNNSWIDKATNKAKPAAFVRRFSNGEDGRPKDHDGLSVNIACRCTYDDVQKHISCYGIALLIIGRIRDTGLDVEEDPEDYIHANIIDMPYQIIDPIEADRLAGLLAKQSQIVWLPPKA